MSWEDILKKEGFQVWLKGEYKGKGRGSPQYHKWTTMQIKVGEPRVFPTREEAFEALKRSGIEKANPRPWTPQGDQYIGRFVVLERNLFEVLGVPTYQYQIIPAGKKPKDNLSASQFHNTTSKEATRRKLEGKNPVPETSSRFKEDNR